MSNSKEEFIDTICEAISRINSHISETSCTHCKALLKGILRDNSTNHDCTIAVGRDSTSGMETHSHAQVTTIHGNVSFMEGINF